MAYTTIDKPTDYFNTVLWVGNGTAIGSGGKTVTGVGFQPDWVWGKARSGTDAVDNHVLTDAVRGATKYLKCNNTSAEITDSESLTSFTSDGFTLGSNGQLNRNGNNCVAWNWLASNTTASNTDGSITSTVSANTTSGFSIVSYTGTGSNATVGHGLGATPDMMIFKQINATRNWCVFHKSIGETKILQLNTTVAETTSGSAFNNTASTSSIINLGDSSLTNSSGNTYIAYCFAEKKGYSKFSSYIGNGSSDGTFVYTGFKPAFVMTKVTSSADSWTLWDNTRDTHNVVTSMLRADTNQVEDTSSSYLVDFISNGFKWRASDGKQNGSGSSYIYMAFAESPFVTSTGIPTTAR